MQFTHTVPEQCI